KTSFPLCPGFPPDTVGLDVKMTPDPFVPGQENVPEILVDTDVLELMSIRLGLL
ncbi:11810_t:CDS:2, partial [Rhizophagus irregularis]